MNTTKNKFTKLIPYITIKKNNIEHFQCYKGSYDYPISDEVIRGLIEGQYGIQKVKEYIEKKDIDFLKFIARYKSIIGNGNFNPYKPYRLFEYYEKNGSFEDLNSIIRYKQSPEIKENIILVGDKGSGKTALQNCWLFENNQKLERENIFWIRCDGHKLYQLWLDSFEDIEQKRNEYGEDRIISIKDYLDLQLVYVFTKYCLDENRPFFKKIISIIKNNKQKFDYPMGKWDRNRTEPRDLYYTILMLRDIIIKKENEKFTIKPDYSYLIDEVMKKSFISHQREKRRWLSVSYSLQRVFSKNGIWILKIVDGVDNVHINEKNTIPYYKKMINECHKFITENPQPTELRFISVRERTHIDIGEIPITDTAPNGIEKKIINHTPSCFKKITQKRYKYFKKNMEFNSLFETIFSQVVDSIDPYINELHHNNVRTFLYNKATLMMQVYYRIKQLGGNMATIKSSIESLEYRNKYLNGRLFLNTFRDFKREMNSELGLCCMNIFYFNLEKYACSHPQQWYGLCKTRILQLLSMNTFMKEERIVSILNIGIGYPKSLILSDIEDLRAFGMIDSKDENGLVFIINIKGKQYLDKSFTDVDTIYYYALDSPLPVFFVENGLINSHENKLSRRTNFPYACISTSVTFIKFINNINAIETERYKRNKHKLGTLDVSSFPNELSLPWKEKSIYKQLIDSAHSKIDSSDSLNIENINIFLNKATEQIAKLGPGYAARSSRSSVT